VSNLCWENKEVTFAGETSKVVTLSGGHIRAPKIVVSSYTPDSGFNFYLSSIGPTTVTIECSGKYTGTVLLHAVSIL
jgi:hypothetical protein